MKIIPLIAASAVWGKVWPILLAVLFFGFIIFFHELGHFIFAKLFKVQVNEFAMGMGPTLFKFKKGATKYALRLFPIGGFVSMVGEDEESDDDNALNRKPVWQRMIITAAGAIMNLLIGIILPCILVISSKTLGSTTIFRFQNDDSTTMQSGLQVGDTITKINNTSTHILNELYYAVMREGTEPVDVTVIRNGEKLVIEDVVFPTIVDSGATFGNIDFYVLAEEKTFGSVIKQSFYQSVSSIRMIWLSLFDLVTGKYGVEQMSGPVGVTSAISEAEQAGSYNILYLSALITLNLGIFNLLPLPALDGGRMVFLLIELIRGKPIKPEYEGYVHFAGIVILMLFMVFITYKDILKLFVN